MANEVIKKDGSREPFNEGKIRRAIEGAAREAGLLDQRISEVVEQVFRATLEQTGRKQEIATSEIRTTILYELQRVEPKVHEAWLTYERRKQNQ